jgi:hypothetical protein
MPSLQATEIGHQLSALHRVIERLTARAAVEVELATMKSPTLLDAIAKARLGLRPLRDGQVVVAERTRTSPCASAPRARYRRRATGVALRLCQLALVDGQRLATLARRQHSKPSSSPAARRYPDRSGDALALSIRAIRSSRPRSPRRRLGSSGASRAAHLARAMASQDFRLLAFHVARRQAKPVELDRFRA